MYRARWRDVPSVNGMSGYFAPHYEALATALESRDVGTLELLARYGDLAVVVDHELDPDAEWRTYVRHVPSATLVAQCGERACFS